MPGAHKSAFPGTAVSISLIFRGFVPPLVGGPIFEGLRDSLRAKGAATCRLLHACANVEAGSSPEGPTGREGRTR